MQVSTNPGSLSYYEQSREEMLTFIPQTPTSLLDVGCGSGGFLRCIKSSMPKTEAWGLELAPEAAKQARVFADKLLEGNVEELIDELPDKYFEIIVFNDVLEHLVEPFEVLEKMKTKLAKNGEIIVSIPNVRYIKNLYHLLIEKDWQYQDNGILDRTHLRFFTEKSIKRSLVENGWKINFQKGVNPTRMKIAYFLLNVLSLGLFSDTKYMNIGLRIQAEK